MTSASDWQESTKLFPTFDLFTPIEEIGDFQHFYLTALDDFSLRSEMIGLNVAIINVRLHHRWAVCRPILWCENVQAWMGGLYMASWYLAATAIWGLILSTSEIPNTWAWRVLSLVSFIWWKFTISVVLTWCLRFLGASCSISPGY